MMVWRNPRTGNRRTGVQIRRAMCGLEQLEIRRVFSIDMVGAPFAEVSAMKIREGGVADLGLPVEGEIGIVDPNDAKAPTVSSVYDDQGRPLSETYEYDGNGDGMIDYRQTTGYVYSGENLVSVSYAEDREADGTVDYRSHSSSSYDSLGQLLSNMTEVDSDGDGAVDYRDSISYTYDDMGHMTSYSSENDANGDGKVDSHYWGNYAYDSLGQMTEATYVSDGNGDGIGDQTSKDSFEYDAAGLIISSVSQYDEDGDGIANQVSTYATTYNADGTQASSTFTADYDGDGDVDYASADQYAYDADGNLLTITSDIDENGDGIVDQTIVTDPQIYTMEGDWVKADDLTKTAQDNETSVGMGEELQDQEADVADGTGIILTFGNAILGDINGDGRFNSADLSLVFQSGQYEDDISGNATWDTGDWDGDGDFTSSDLILAMNLGHFEADANQIVSPIEVETSESRLSSPTMADTTAATDQAFADEMLVLYASLDENGAV